MSERGSFCTEYIYCEKCLDAAKRVLLRKEKHLCSTAIHDWNGDGELPIIAGKIGGMHSGEELLKFELDLVPELEELICHELRIAVLADVGQNIFTAKPKFAVAKN